MGTQLTGADMSIVTVVALLIVVAVATALLPMDARIKQLIYIVVAVGVVLWLLHVLGLLDPLYRYR
jgi:hypothetical protein